MKPLDRAVTAQALLNKGADQRPVGAQCCVHVGIIRQHVNEIAEQIACCLGAGHDECQAEAHNFVIGQPVALGLGLDEGRHEVIRHRPARSNVGVTLIDR